MPRAASRALVSATIAPPDTRRPRRELQSRGSRSSSARRDPRRRPHRPEVLYRASAERLPYCETLRSRRFQTRPSSPTKPTRRSRARADRRRSTSQSAHPPPTAAHLDSRRLSPSPRYPSREPECRRKHASVQTESHCKDENFNRGIARKMGVTFASRLANADIRSSTLGKPTSGWPTVVTKHVIVVSVFSVHARPADLFGSPRLVVGMCVLLGSVSCQSRRRSSD